MGSNIGDGDKPAVSVMPICWDTQENWAEWQRLNVEAKDNSAKRLDHFCNDCMPEYRDQMIFEGRCAYPSTVFVRIIERQFNPVTGARRNVTTNAVRGHRLEDSLGSITRGDIDGPAEDN